MRLFRFLPLLTLLFLLPNQLLAQATEDESASKEDNGNDDEDVNYKARSEALEKVLKEMYSATLQVDKKHGTNIHGDLDDDDKDEKLKWHWRMASKDGWRLGIDLGLITDWDANNAITGVDNGTHFKLGGKFDFIASNLSGNHEWRFKVGFIETFAKTPTIDNIVKSRDDFEAEAQYLWWIGGESDPNKQWFSLSAEVRMDTSIFPGYNYEEHRSNFFIVDQFGNPLRTYANTNILNVNTWFLPMNFKQLLGITIRPIRIPEFSLEFKPGGYIIESIADDMLTEISRSGKDITLKVLKSFVHLGPSLGIKIFGKLPNLLNIDYRLVAEGGYATVNTHTVDSEPNFTDDLHFAAELDVKLNPFESIGIELDLEVQYDPSTSKDIQFTHKIFLNLPIELN